MNIWFYLFCGAALLLLIVLIVAIRFVQRTFQFDELFSLLDNDIAKDLTYLEQVVNTPLFSNAPEVIAVAKNMRVLHDNLRNYAARIAEVTKPEQSK